MSNPAERRRHQRVPRFERLAVQVVSSSEDTLSPGMTLKCSSQDISSQGLKIRAERPVNEGCQLELWVEISGRRNKFHLAGEVKWCRKREGEDGHDLGIELIDDGQASDLKPWRELLLETDLLDADEA